MQFNNPLLILVGPTAVGKTQLSLQLSERLDCEIVSADSRLFYRGMDIGTAKPTVEERTRISHHLIDICQPDEIVSLTVFQKLAVDAISTIQARGRLPILVGGTGQYIRAVVQGWKPPEVKPNEGLRSILEGLVNNKGGSWLHDGLHILDPEAAAKVDSRNYRRTIRAIEVIFTTGRKFSEQRTQGRSPYKLVTIGLTRPRPELYARVDVRIEAMFKNGFIEEVKGLLDGGYPPTLPAFSAIGYRECIKVIQGEWTIEQAKAEIRRVTRIFVRRQSNWFKESDPHIKWFDAGGENILEILEAEIRNSFRSPHV